MTLQLQGKSSQGVAELRPPKRQRLRRGVSEGRVPGAPIFSFLSSDNGAAALRKKPGAPFSSPANGALDAANTRSTIPLMILDESQLSLSRAGGNK
jgi:hypothetical protein